MTGQIWRLWFFKKLLLSEVAGADLEPS